MKISADNKFHLSETWQRADLEQYFDYDQVPDMFVLGGGVNFGEMAWTLSTDLGDLFHLLVNKTGELAERFDFIEKDETGFVWEDYTYIVDGEEHPWHTELVPQGYFDRWKGGHDILGLALAVTIIGIISKVVPIGSILKSVMGTRGIKGRHNEVLGAIEKVADALDGINTVPPMGVPTSTDEPANIREMLETLITAWADNSRTPLRTTQRSIAKADKLFKD